MPEALKQSDASKILVFAGISAVHLDFRRLATDRRSSASLRNFRYPAMACRSGRTFPGGTYLTTLRPPDHVWWL